MSILEALFLGIIQGATEFLPISSSGHLVLVPAIFSLTPPSLNTHRQSPMRARCSPFSSIFGATSGQIIMGVFNGLVQREPMGTTDSRLGWYIAVGSIPAAAAGLLFADYFEEVFGNPTAVAFFLLVTAALLVSGERQLIRCEDPGRNELAGRASVIGLFQMLALFPGISRSGSTITAGLWRGLDRETAARYSFLLGVPAILGAGLLSLLDLQQSGTLAI